MFLQAIQLFLLVVCKPVLQEQAQGEEEKREMAMEKNVLVICAVVGFLGIVSAAVAFAAEATKIKDSHIKSTIDGCIYPRSASVELGFISALMLLIAQIIINIVTGCYCCKTHQNSSSNNRTIGLMTFIISWVTFVFAFLMLLASAAINNQRNQPYSYDSDQCIVLKPGVFSGAAILVLATVSLGLISYISLSSSKNIGSWGPQSQGTAMGQPQFPAPGNQPGSWAPQQNQGFMPGSQPPVFVHEDTHHRQQYP